MMRTIARAVRLGTIPPLVLATPVLAAERAWIAPAGGAFDDAMNWSDGAVPLATDVAVFDIGGSYVVEFTTSAVTDRVVVDSGIVLFQLDAGDDYRQLDAYPLTPGLAVGAGDGVVASLEVVGGGLRAVHAVVGGADNVAFLDARDDGAWIDVESHVWIGDAGTGLVTIANGARMSSARGVLGRVFGAYGSASIEGPTTRWDAIDAITVGDRGAGALTVRDGAHVTSSVGVIAKSAGSIGDVVLDGGHWTLDGTLDVGMRGDGAIVVRNGGTLTNRSFAVIGTYPDDDGIPVGRGMVTIEGAGSTWRIDGGFFAGNLDVGYGGQGHLTLRDGGRLVLDGDLYMESDFGSTLTVELGDATSGHAIIDAGGAVSGHVDVVLAPKAVPSVGTSFDLVRASGITATFDLPALPADLAWAVQSTSTAYRASIVPATCALDVVDDCNANGIDDACEVLYGIDDDCNGNGVPDRCERADRDCDGNGVLDACDLAAGADDCNANGVLDVCEAFAQNIRLDEPGADDFGLAVAISGDRAVVGAPQSGAAGTAFVYRLDEATWMLEATLEPPPGADDTWFGRSVAIDGDRIVVGAPALQTRNSGRILVYHRSGEDWIIEAEIEPSIECERFGDTVVIDDPIIATGAIAPYGGPFSGRTFIHRRDGAAWHEEHIEVTHTGGSFVIRAPTSAVSGNVLATAFWSVYDVSVRILRYDGVRWNLERIVDPPEQSEDGRFGYARTGVPLSTDGQRVVIGGRVGTAPTTFTVRYDGAEWVDEAMLQPLDSDGEGNTPGVVMQGDALFTSVLDEDDHGAIFAYAFVDGAWRPDGSWESIEPVSALGNEVDLSAGRLIAGTRTSDAADGAFLFNVARTADCNDNGVPDDCDIASGRSPDVNLNGVPDECEELCIGDVDGSGSIGFHDLLRVLTAWGPCLACPEDVDRDGTVGLPDLLLVLTAWGPCP